jgi:hypothetical protein
VAPLARLSAAGSEPPGVAGERCGRWSSCSPELRRAPGQRGTQSLCSQRQRLILGLDFGMTQRRWGVGVCMCGRIRARGSNPALCSIPVDAKKQLKKLCADPRRMCTHFTGAGGIFKLLARWPESSPRTLNVSTDTGAAARMPHNRESSRQLWGWVRSYQWRKVNGATGIRCRASSPPASGLRAWTAIRRAAPL